MCGGTPLPQGGAPKRALTREFGSEEINRSGEEILHGPLEQLTQKLGKTPEKEVMTLVEVESVSP
jgi:hypothetical protein